MQHFYLKDFRPSVASVSIDSLEQELAALFLGLALVADECISSGAGSRMLGLPEDQWQARLFGRGHIRSTRIGRLLPVWFKYAYHGVVAAGFEPDYWEQADGALERLGDFLGLLRIDDGYFEDCLLTVGADIGPGKAIQGHLSDLVRRVHARLALDQGATLDIEALALLADMNERSVRNAVSLDGDARLVLGDDSKASNEEAVRWLNGRRGFVATKRRELPREAEQLPAALDDIEIPGFLESRLKALWDRPDYQDGVVADATGQPAWLVRAAREAGLRPERLDAATQLPFDIHPHECEGLAKAARLDPVWFTYQVMTALFPKEIDMLLNTMNWRADEAPGKSEPPPEAVTVELTAAMLAHGYIDLPAWSKQLFPADCFGTREEGGEAAGRVELRYGSHHAETDIRVKSAKTISPRRRFTAWLNSELGAQPGDRIRVERAAERVFTLTHLSKAKE